MESMASRRNDSPFRTNSSYAISRRTENSLRRQSSTIASSSGSFKPGYSPQRTIYNTRQSLSKSYDSPEGILTRSQASAKKLSSPQRRTASPPACSSIRRQDICANGRNQTILDDAAWMSERINNLQKTGFLRYPSISKLRASGDMPPSLAGSGSYKDDEGMPFLPSSSPSCFNQISTLRPSQTVVNQADEPLSAFRLSEVTLSEEDLLTDISSSREFSTCSSTPVSMQSCHNFDPIASELYQASLSLDAGKDYHKYLHHSIPNGSSASSECTTSNVRGDLLLRLEALQYRAELAAKEENDSHSSNPNHDQNSKHFWDGQGSHSDQDTLPSNQKQGECIQQTNAVSVASPTQSNITIESVSWREELEKSVDSTCWLKASNKDVKGEPRVSHLIHSTSRSIRPEYYLPLSKEEEPVLEPGVSVFSSPKEMKRTEMRNDNIRRLALGGLSPMRQRKSKEIRPGKSVSNHKQAYLARKSRRSLESSMDSVDGSVKARGMWSFNMSGPSSSNKFSPAAARRTLPIEARASQSPVCVERKGFADHMQGQRNSITQSFGEKDTRSRLDNRLEYDGESSWISEENVEGFLRSRSFAVDEVDALSTSHEWYSPAFDRNLFHCTARTSSSLFNDRPSRNKNSEKSATKECGTGILSSSYTHSACFNKTTVNSSNESMTGDPMFDHCKELPPCFQDGSAITNQTGSHGSACQISHWGDESFNYDSIRCFKDILYTEQSKGSQNDAGAKEQIFVEEGSVSCSAVPWKNLDRGMEGSVEDKVTFEAQSAALQSEQVIGSTDIGLSQSARCTLHTSIPKEQNCPLSLDALSSPEDVLVEHRQWPVLANRSEKAAHTDEIRAESLLEGGSPEHRIFSRIVRSLSFSEQEKSGPKSSSNLQAHSDLIEPKSISFSHYWIRNSAYCCDLQSDGGKDSRRTEGDNFHCAESLNALELQQTSALAEKELTKVIPSLRGMSEISDMDQRYGGNEASLILQGNSCRVTSIVSDCNAVVTNEAPLSSIRSSQQYHDLELDNAIEILYKAHDAPISVSVREDSQRLIQLSKVPKAHDAPISVSVREDSQRLIQLSKVPKVGKQAVDSKGCHQQAGTKFTVEEDLGTKILPIRKYEPADGEPEVVLSQQHMNIASFDNQNNGLMLEDVTKDETLLNIPCSPGPTNGGREEMSTPGTSSLLSIYKNPLWLDEVSVDFENQYGSQNQEFLGISHSDEQNIGSTDTEKNRIGCSKRYLGEVWDTYEGMGGFVGPFPTSLSYAKERVANHILVGSDNPQNSSDSNSFALNSVGRKHKKLGEEFDDVHVPVCEPCLSENFSNFEDLVTNEVPGLEMASYSDHHQQLTPTLEIIKSQTISHDAFSSSSVKVKDITEMIDNNCNITSFCSPLAHLERSENIYQLKENSTTQVSSNGAQKPDDLENQDAALVPKESTVNHFFPNAELKCGTWEKMMSVPEVACQTDETKACRKAHDKLDYNGCKIRKEVSRQKSGACINTERTSERKLCEQYDRGCFQPVELRIGSENVDAPEENFSTEGPVLHSNDGEEVKKVTFIYSDSKQQRKDSEAVEASLPEVPLEVLSTWVLSFFSHATKGGGNVKKKEQNQLLIQDMTREDQAELNKIGKKVEALEAEIDRFKQENRKLQNVVKCLIRKMKQLHQGFRGRKRHASRGFMTCIYSVRVKRSRSKVLRKS